MSTIQQAAKRLEELRRAVAIPWEADYAEAKARAEALGRARSFRPNLRQSPSQPLPMPLMPAMPAMPAVHAPSGRQSNS